MNDKFLGNCVNSNNCLNFTCEQYTPKHYNHNTIPSPTWCDKHNKLVFIEPYTSEDWDTIQATYSECNEYDPIVIGEYTLLIQEEI